MDAKQVDPKAQEDPRTIGGLVTPALLLDKHKLERNIQRLAKHVSGLGAVLRPHMKTAKSIDVARCVFPDGPGLITVSTLAEAEYFAGFGFQGHHLCRWRLTGCRRAGP